MSVAFPGNRENVQNLVAIYCVEFLMFMLNEGTRFFPANYFEADLSLFEL